MKTNDTMKRQWSEQLVLAEARRRTKELQDSDKPSNVLQRTLAALLVEAGWTEEEFIDVLCADVIRRGESRSKN